MLVVIALALIGPTPAHAGSEEPPPEAPAQPESCDGPAMRGQVREQGPGGANEPVEGVTVVVADPDGNEIGRGVTNDRGQALICLPGRIDLQIFVDEETLPEETALQNPDPLTVSAEQFTTNTRTVNFFLGEGERRITGYWARLAQSLVNGARLGLVIAMASVGLSLIFGTTGLTNFAHGEMVTFGGIVTWWLSASVGLPFLLAAPIMIVVGGFFGLLLDWGIFERLRRRGVGLISQLVVSVGLSILLVNLFLARFGGSTRRYPAFNVQEAFSVGPVSITPRDATTGAIALVVLVGVALFLSRSRLGKATRAVSDNPDLASTTGIDSRRIIRIVWFLGGSLAALGGIIRGLDEGVKPAMGGELLFLLFAGITLGGLGSAYGALLGGFLVGLFVEVSVLGIPAIPEMPGLLRYISTGVPTELKTVPALGLLVLILLFRPQGILGRRERVG